MTAWNCIRASYFEADQTSLIGDLLGPLALELAGRDDVRRAFLRAHWRQGPHVMLAVDCPSETFDDVVFPTCRQIIEAWLAEHPSTTVLDPEVYARQSRTLASAEADDRPLTPLFANNTVEIGSYDPPPPLGLPALAEVRDQFLCDAVGLVRDLLALRAQDRDRFYGAIAAMMVCVNEVSGEPWLKHVSFRAHAEAYCMGFPGAREMFKPFEAKYQARFTEAVEEAIEEFGAGTRYGGRSAILSRWVSLVDGLARTIRPIVSANIDEIRRSIQDRLSPAENSLDNPFFESMRSPAGQRVLGDEEHNVFRVAINQLYLLFPLLNISPIQRFCLSNIVANACEAVTGVSWTSRLTGRSPVPSAL